VTTNFRHGAIVRTITSFAENLGLRLIAEGVETEAQADLLRNLGCTLGQGYLYAKPMPGEALEQLLASGLPHPRGSEVNAVA
jgi:EAL domain-containing protein (putative c-di-GMP-specific phosphodiesterase class I)